jgi:hypothetical protein
MANLTTGLTAIDAPTRIPVQGGLFQAADVAEVSGPSLMGVFYETDGIYDALAVADDMTTCVETAASETTGFNFIYGNPVHIYAAVECNGFDNEIGDFAAAATARLMAGEQRLLEQIMWTRLLPEAATDLNPAGALAVKKALGVLDEYMGLHYTYVPTLHFGKRLAPYLADHFLVKFDGDKASAVGGSLAVNGAGYVGTEGPKADPDDDDGVEAGANEVWLYETGQVGILQGPVQVTSVRNPKTNALFAVAYRTDVITIDGPTVAVRVTLD